MAALKGWIEPLEAEDTRRWDEARAVADEGDAVAEAVGEGVGLGGLAGCVAEHFDFGEDFGEGVGVEGDDAGLRREVGHVAGEGGAVDGADAAKVLQNHEIGSDLGEAREIDEVKAAALRPLGGDDGVDLRGGEVGREMREDDARLCGGFRREVALEGDGSDLWAGADGEEDLGGGGKEGADFHCFEDDSAIEARGIAWVFLASNLPAFRCMSLSGISLYR